MQSIFSQIRREMNDFMFNQIEVVPGFTFNQYDTIKRIHLYTNSKFENDTPYHGRRRIFFNKVNPARDTVAKAIDIDRKDIKLKALNPNSDVEAFFAEKEFKYWMKENEVGQVLNELATDLATYGSIVVKCLDDKMENIDLRRLFLDPTVKSIEDSRFVTQELYMTAPELREMKGKWDNIEEVIEKFGSYYAPQSYADEGQTNIIDSSPYFKIYERYGEVPRGWINDTEDTEMVRALFIVAEAGATSTSTINSEVVNDEGIILSKMEWKDDYPFEDCHYQQVKGRWLGLGPVEQLFPAQERFNELANQKRIAMELSSIHLFQGADRKVARNLADYVQNGDYILTDSPISPIANEERNLSAFQYEEGQYKNLADSLTFTYDATRGEALPASTPATNAVIQNNNVNSFFAVKRENFGLFLECIFNEHILPRLLKDLNKEHMLRFIGAPEDMGRFDELISPYFVKKQVIQEVLQGDIVDSTRLELIKQTVMDELKKKGSQRFIEIKQDWYKNCEIDFDFIITNEQEDTAVITQNTFGIINLLASNPMLIEDPVTRTLVYKYADMIGVSSLEIDLALQKRQQAQASQPQQIQQPLQTAQVNQ